MATDSRKMEKVHKIWVESSGRRVQLQTLTLATQLIKDVRSGKTEDSVPSCLYLQRSESIVFQEGEPDDRHQQELHSERVIC